MEISQESLMNFCDLTGSSTEDAYEYLTVTDGSLESAISFYYDNQGKSLKEIQEAAEEQQRKALEMELQKEQEKIRIEEPVLEQSSTSQRIPHSSQTIPRRNIAQYSAIDGINFPARVLYTPEENIIRNARRSQDNDSGDEQTPYMFDPPVRIMKYGTLEMLRDAARKMNRFIMVNIIDTTDFHSQTTNRDVWSNEDLKDLVDEKFIFVQYIKASSWAEEFINYYHVLDFPHISILDPLTGECLVSWHYVFKSEVLIERICAFLRKNDLDIGNIEIQANKKPKSDMIDLTEEEQLAVAIKASIESLPGCDSSALNTESENEFEEDFKRIEASIKSTDYVESPLKPIITEDRSKNSVESIDDIVAFIPPEPIDKLDVAKIQFRFPDGTKYVHIFDKSTPVKVLYQFAKAKAPSHYNLELNYIRDSLKDKIAMSLEEAGLANSSLTVNYELK